MDARAPVVPRGGGNSARTARNDEVQRQFTVQQGAIGVTFETAEPMPAGLPPEEYAEEMRPVLYDFGRHRIALSEGQSGAWEQLDLQAQESGWTHSHAALTPHEAQLIAASAVKGAREWGRAAKLVLLSLITGRSFAELMAIKDQPRLGGSWKQGQRSLCFSPDVTDLRDPLMNGYRMDFPDGINIWERSQEGDIEGDVRKWLGSLGLNRRPRMTWIKRALADAPNVSLSSFAPTFCGFRRYLHCRGRSLVDASMNHQGHTMRAILFARAIHVGQRRVGRLMR